MINYNQLVLVYFLDGVSLSDDCFFAVFRGHYISIVHTISLFLGQLIKQQTVAGLGHHF
jgi:hypothetical protein